MSPVVEAVTEPLSLGEAPHWDAAAQALFFVNIFGNAIHKYHPASGKHTSAKMATMPTFVIPVEGKPEHFVVGTERTVVLVHWSGEGEARVVREVAAVHQDDPKTRMNDAKADPRGRLFAGTLGEELGPGNHRPTGSLFRIDPKGRATTVEDKIKVSNGLCWDVEAKAFYYVDSLDFAIRRYDYDVETGDISNPKMIFKLSEHKLPGAADGITVDTDGNLWVAFWDGKQVLQIDPRTGSILQRVPIPAQQVTSLTWGGSGLDELYVTTAAIDKTQLPPCGSIFRVTGLGARGRPGVSAKIE